MTTQVQNTAELIFVGSELPKLRESYKLTLSEIEVNFVRNFCNWMFAECEFAEYLLELTTLHRFYHRFKQRLHEPKDCTLTLYPNEAIALKRLLWIPVIVDRETDNHRNNVHGYLDQMMIGIK